MKDYWRKFHSLKSLLGTTKAETQMLLQKLTEEQVDEVIAGNVGKARTKANALLSRVRNDVTELAAKVEVTPTSKDVTRFIVAITKCANIDAALAAFEHAAVVIRRCAK